MTESVETIPCPSDDEEQGNLSELSLSSVEEVNPPPEEEEIINETLPTEFDEALHIDESQTQEVEEKGNDDDLTQFIAKARQQDYNCLDLSKKNIVEFPVTLLEFPSLQYLYLEGNQISRLPDDLFFRLSNMKWIDLRNNQITHIPIIGLDKHNSLRYLLLGGNLIRTLPIELGKVKGLSALNLDGNPLDHPPFEIVKQGIKAIQQYLRNQSEHADEEEEEERRQTQLDDSIADVWASSDEENLVQPQKTRSRLLKRPSIIFPRKSKSEVDYYESPSAAPNRLLQSCLHFKRVSYSEMRMRTPSSARQRARKTKTISNDPIADAFAARAQEEQRQIRLKHRNMKINEQLQKVKNKEYADQWKEDYRESQQQLRRKRLIKGKDYQQAVVKAPFGIDPHYIPVMNTDQQEMVEKAIRYESRRNRSPESAMREEEERRIRDRQVQDRIREITTKMIQRRNGVRGNAFEEKRQAELELRELRKLESEVKERRNQIDSRFKAYTGDVKARKRL